ncbi:phosphonate C-P lyase system protein PhnL [Pseudothauera nasutitermitis]|uniref:Phosphonate C-P lyase system protein PhnL n=1 Tax=Pseudothauera nasutitermitis TaxID=2565930 RepID=A0A4S4AVD2_9RHOO|nr:phosphonate C-P lyase system protein PhnL [Pseudothauera nasutitermitis]THF63946.1 phosphonate C-P lyase system protein PhnL [Pseudothauera nasutitermitis]
MEQCIARPATATAPLPARPPMLEVRGLDKHFILHMQGGVRIPVFEGAGFEVRAGECLTLAGPSGAGKSTLLRCLYGNYLVQRGSIRVRHRGEPVELVGAPARRVLDVRRATLGHVSQFLRVIPRVASIDLVMEPLLARGVAADEARARAEALLARLNIPPALWALAPATFSGGEQQRVNIARGFIAEYPVMLLDEPTASLDADNRSIVIQLIQDALARGAAIVGIFHDEEVRAAVGQRSYAVGHTEAAA